MLRNRYARLALNLTLSSVLPLIAMVSGFGLFFRLTDPFRSPVTTDRLRLPDNMPLVVPWICRDIDRLNRLRENWPFISTNPYKDLMYVDGDVLITGDEIHVGKVLDLIDPERKPQLALLARRRPPDIQLAQERQADLPRIQRENQRATFRYQVIRPESPGAAALSVAARRPIDSRSVAKLTCMVNVIRNLYAADVRAEPNYHLSPAGWAGGGSPWTQNGGGWIQGLDGGGLNWAEPTKFKTQWAFTSQGIDLFDDSEQPQRKPRPDVTGEGVRIGIFDTSPFDDREWIMGTVEGSRVCEDCLLQDLVQGTVPPDFADMRMTVWHNPLEPTPDCPGWDRHKTMTDTLETQNLSSHGLFVASLAHTVAPSSTLYLVRVLENDACGSLYSINDGIEKFMAQAVADNVGNVVINLSLGVHQPPNPRSYGLPSEVTTLQTTIQTALDTQGIEVVVVAAAGNDSYLPGSPVDMEIPAQDASVIGVAASNKARKRSCFSNADLTTDNKNVAAPGGDGEFVDDANPCVIPSCSDSNPDLCVISLVHPPQSGKANYAYWVGTSFAAPLVSGQRALLLPLLEGAGSITPTTTTCRASDDALPNGITNLLKPLEGTCSTIPSP